MTQRWYVRTNGTLFGPYEENDLRNFVENDRLTPETEVAESPEGPYFPAARIPGMFPGMVLHPPRAAAGPGAGRVFCYKCGASIFAESEICPHCGVRQKHPARHDILTGDPNRVVAALLAFFLGLLGAHKFYLGQTTAGVVYLIFGTFLCWLIFPAIVIWVLALIDGIVYLTYSDEAFAARYARE